MNGKVIMIACKCGKIKRFGKWEDIDCCFPKFIRAMLKKASEEAELKIIVEKCDKCTS